VKRKRRTDKARLEVTGLTARGAGEAEHDGQPVVVRGALPGELVEARIDGRHATVASVITTHPQRVEPACPIADRCGGCDWMHASLTFQREAQEAMWRAQLEAHWDGPLTLHEVGPPLGYRCRARLAVQARKGVRIGYRRARSHQLVELGACPILRPELEAAIPELRDALAGSRGDGEAALALGAGAAPVLDLRFAGELDGAVFGRIHDAVQAGRWAGARVWDGDVAKPATFGDPRPRVEAADGASLVIAPGGFSQPSLEAGRVLSAHVAKVVPPSNEVVELFAGSGTLTVALRAGPLREASDYLVVEEVADARAALLENLDRRDLPAVRFHVGDANDVSLPRGLPLVVLDPPRRGAAGAIAAIAEARVKRVAYVSCDPVSLARDLAALGDAYRCVAAEAFRLFPQTHHLETVVLLERR